MRKTVTRLPLAVLFIVGSSMSAHAASYTFNFDALPDAAGKNNSAIATYMNGVLAGMGSAATVVVGGDAQSENNYNGDGHVVCAQEPCNGSPSRTLGTDEAGKTDDTFIRNVAGKTWWSFTFTGLTIADVKFDYEIFPDASCASLVPYNCSSRPDFKFSTNTTGLVFQDFGVQQPSSNNDSPIQGSNNNELTPQKLVLGYVSPALNNATVLTFTDWPATIGIDNLIINTPNGAGAVPEPGTMILLGSGLATLYARRKQRTAR